MPIIITNGCKSYPRKALEYVLKKSVAADTNGLFSEDFSAVNFSNQFLATSRSFGKKESYDTRKYYHVKISFEPNDRIENGGNLDIETAMKTAADFLQNHYSDYEYIFACHNDTKHLHIHAIVNAVSFIDGRKIHHTNKELSDEKDEINTIAENYGLSAFDWRSAVKEKREKAKRNIPVKNKLTAAEKHIKENNPEDFKEKSWKEALRQQINEAKKHSYSRQEFSEYLYKHYGVTMPRNTNKTVSFLRKDAEENEKPVRGAKLGEKYTAEAIDKAISENIRIRELKKYAKAKSKLEKNVAEKLTDKIKTILLSNSPVANNKKNKKSAKNNLPLANSKRKPVKPNTYNGSSPVANNSKSSVLKDIAIIKAEQNTHKKVHNNVKNKDIEH